ncbi:MAG TPA: DUF952 domain-containing protein [Bacteroidales bacterium]|nr:DUF952 domain-containing protein [Bacteroidales bacterium]
MIYHITTHEDWEKARVTGEYKAASLHSEGFIHCSTLKQTIDTANLFFKGKEDLILLCIDENKLKPECKYENPAGGRKHDPAVGNLFPHVYGPINIPAIIKIVDFPSGKNGLFMLPDGICND